MEQRIDLVALPGPAVFSYAARSDGEGQRRKAWGHMREIAAAMLTTSTEQMP